MTETHSIEILSFKEKRSTSFLCASPIVAPVHGSLFPFKECRNVNLSNMGCAVVIRHLYLNDFK